MNCSDRSVHFLFIGRPALAKGLPDLLRALARMAESSWKLSIGGAVQRADLPEMDPVGDNCRILGAVEHRAVPGLMHNADVVVVPSRYENFCNVALEAMAAGRPVVGSDCGGIPDLVDVGITGLLFAPGSIDELEARLRAAAADTVHLNAMGRRGWYKARAYSWNRVGSETDRFLRTLIEG